MSDQQPKQTPILDLLRDIPADARMVYEVNPTHHQSIPVGVLAHQAADEIDRLRAERDDNAWWRKEMADKLHDRETHIADQSRQIERLRAESDAFAKLAKENEMKVVTCGVAAEHSDANLTRTGAYAKKWDSAQAESVRGLRAERDELRRQLAEAERDARRYRWLRENLGKWRIETYQTPEQSMVELHIIGESCFYSGEVFDRIIDGQRRDAAMGLTRPAEE